jgi:hypothetical protein
LTNYHVLFFLAICIQTVLAEDPPLSFSRSLRAYTGQVLEIPYTGTGWVYLGELSAQRGISYDSRRIDPDGQTFIFHIGTPGTFALKFYRQDFVHNYVINDYVMVMALDPPAYSATSWFNPPEEPSRITASPRWPPLSILEPAAVLDAPTEESIASISNPAQYLQLAQQAYDTKRIPEALSIMDRLIEHYPAGSDEAWWLYGQLFEVQSPSRDVQTAFQYYHRLVQEYPHSPRATLALKRIAYLERYYFAIQ